MLRDFFNLLTCMHKHREGLLGKPTLLQYIYHQSSVVEFVVQKVLDAIKSTSELNLFFPHPSAKTLGDILTSSVCKWKCFGMHKEQRRLKLSHPESAHEVPSKTLLSFLKNRFRAPSRAWADCRCRRPHQNPRFPCMAENLRCCSPTPFLSLSICMWSVDFSWLLGESISHSMVIHWLEGLDIKWRKTKSASWNLSSLLSNAAFSSYCLGYSKCTLHAATSIYPSIASRKQNWANWLQMNPTTKPSRTVNFVNQVSSDYSLPYGFSAENKLERPELEPGTFCMPAMCSTTTSHSLFLMSQYCLFDLLWFSWDRS